MGIVSRGFQGRRRQPGAGLIPPGQYVVDDFPVLSAGPTPFTPVEEWDFTIVDETGSVAARWTWDEFRDLPAGDTDRRHPLCDEVVQTRHPLGRRLG